MYRFTVKSNFILNKIQSWLMGSGIACVVAFLLLANANAVLSGNLLQHIHPFLLLFWCFLITSIFFQIRLVLFSDQKTKVMKPGSFGLTIVLNAVTAFNWIGYFLALRYVEPAIVSALMGGFGPLSTIFWDHMIRKQKQSLSIYLVAMGILSGASILVVALLMGLSGTQQLELKYTVIGLVAGIIGGVSQALTIVVSKKMGDNGWTATQIMAYRFHLLVFIAAILAYYSGPGIVITSRTELLGIALVTVLGVVLPLWLLQRGILLSEPFIVAALLAWAPLLTYFFQVFDSRIEMSSISFLGCMVVVFFSLLGIAKKSNIKR